MCEKSSYGLEGNMQIIVLFTVLVALYLLPKTKQTAHKRSADNSMLLPVLEIKLAAT